MGCPDWPKCFGSFIPPTSVSQLPADYKEYYSAYRDKKNQRFASFLNSMGQKETAAALLNDPQVKQEGDFDPVKTMIEYINRLVGALIGLLLTALFVYSFWQAPIYRILTGLAWFFVLVTGWFGSIVVSTNLTPWTVTIHLGLAFLIIILLSAADARSKMVKANSGVIPLSIILISGLFLMIQIYLGTTVRSEVDALAASGIDRSNWVSGFSSKFLIHRTSSWVVLASFATISWRLIKRTGDRFSAFALSGLILALMLTGAILNYLGMPFFVQPVHLLLSSMAIGLLVNISLKYSLSTN